MTSVAAVITTYNRPDALRSALDSVFGQTRAPDQVFVVDDCSPVDSAAVTDPFGDRVTLIRNAFNLGPSACRNIGVRAADTDWVAFLDDDDRWSPDKLEAQIAASDDTDAVLCGYRLLETGGARVQRSARVTVRDLRHGNPFCGASGLMARRTMLLAEPFDEAIWNGEDWDLFVRLAGRRPLAYVRRPLFLYSVGTPSVQSLSNSTVGLALPRTETKLLALEKNRAAIGDFHYRVRKVGLRLRFLQVRRSRRQVIRRAVAENGLLPVLAYLAGRLRLKLASAGSGK